MSTVQKILILGGDARHLGAQARALSVLEDVCAVYAGTPLWIELRMFHSDALTEPLPPFVRLSSFRLSRWPDLLWHLQRADQVVVADASPWLSLPERPHFPLMKSILPFVTRQRGSLYAGRMGAIMPEAPSLLSMLARNVGITYVGDPAGLDWFERHGGTGRTVMTGDSLFTLTPPPTKDLRPIRDRYRLGPPDRPVAALLPRRFFFARAETDEWPGRLRLSGGERAEAEKSNERFVRQMAAYSQWLISHLGARVLLLSTSPSDLQAASDIYRQCPDRREIRLVPHETLGPRSLQRLLGASDLFVTTHYHAAALGSAMGTPMIGVTHDHSQEILFREMGLSAWWLDYATYPNLFPNLYHLDENLIDLTKTLWLNRSSWAERVLDAHRCQSLRSAQTREIWRKRDKRLSSSASPLKPWVEAAV